MTNGKNKKQKNEPTFARDLGLFDATMIGTGAMIGAGIFVLTGLAAGVAGPASILSFVFNGLVTLITAFAYAELASTIPRAGGGYSFVRMAFPGATGFITGWILWFAYTVACSLYALGFGGYFWELTLKYSPGLASAIHSILGEHSAILLVTFFIASVFIWLNIRGAEVTGKTENVLTLAKIAILSVFIFFGLSQIFSEPGQAMQNFTPFFPKGYGGVIVAMGLTFIAFEGYDLIATISEEIKSPEKNIPRATFISLGIAIVIYILILFVSLGAINVAGPSWEFLGKYKETAIVRAAEAFMPAIGVGLIVFGGLLSTMSALNATVMAASRVAFSMGRDLLLPPKMSRIHNKRRTPHIAVFVTGTILIVIALTLPIEAVGSAASLIFLLTFAMVNLSLIALRRKYPEIPRKFSVPFYPYLPILGFILNIFLAIYQFQFQPIAWYVTLAWVSVGLLLYYAVFEKRASTIEPQVLLPGKAELEDERDSSVIISINNPDNIETLLKIGMAVARQRKVRLIAISVVVVPRQTPIHEGLRYAHHKEPLLAEAKKISAQHEIAIETDIIIAHRAADGILEAANKYKAEALVIGWKGFTNARDRIFGEIADRIIRLAPCDLMVLKTIENGSWNKCLLPSAGGPNAQLASNLLNFVAKDFNMKVTVGYILDEKATAEDRALGEQRMDLTLSNFDSEIDSDKKIFESKSIAGGIAKASLDYDLVVIGAAKEPFFRKMLFGEIPEKVARYSPNSVLVVKKFEGVLKNLIKRALG